ncbi:MAG: hypothetical protein RL535_1061, partial [Pseudomonadota bacterium]
ALKPLQVSQVTNRLGSLIHHGERYFQETTT